MSSRPNLTPYKVITNGDMSGSIVSSVTIVQKISMISYAFSWAGTSPVGAVSIEVSNDYTQDAQGHVLNAGTWNTLTLEVNGSTASSVAVSGNTGNGFIDIDKTAAFAMRARYTATSGVGSLQCTVSGKVS